ncbi:hypothetical protein [Bordetella trematum]|uniref:hypothetical protein n=1 Tax=Bordetella trematum TaxID=123899 RepID=UPI003989DE47
MEEKDYLDWVETAAVENFKAQHFTADVLAKESALTLTVMMAAMAAGMAYAIKGITSDAPGVVEYGAIAFTTYLMGCSFWLVVGCMKIHPISPVFNEPKNLLNDAYTFAEIRRFELKNMQDGIDEAAIRNGTVARRLNSIRQATIASPIIFVVVAVGAWAISEAWARYPASESGAVYLVEGNDKPVPAEVWGCPTLLRSYECE